MLLDRRDAVPRRVIRKLPRSSLFGGGDGDDDAMDVDADEDPEEAEKFRRLQEQWKYDSDDTPPVGPEGPDEQNRILVDDYHPKYVFCSDFSDPIINKFSQLPPSYHDPLQRDRSPRPPQRSKHTGYRSRLPNALCHSISTWHATAAISQRSHLDALPSRCRSTAVSTRTSFAHGSGQRYPRFDGTPNQEDAAADSSSSDADFIQRWNAPAKHAGHWHVQQRHSS